VQRSERLMMLLELLHNSRVWMPRRLPRLWLVHTDAPARLDALGAAGFPVYFERGYRLAAPTLLPAVTLTVDQALALRMAAASTALRAELATARALSVAAQKLEQAMAAQPPEDQIHDNWRFRSKMLAWRPTPPRSRRPLRSSARCG